MASDPRSDSPGMFRTITLVVTVAAAIASLAFMFMVGRQQKSVVLMALFAAWVVSPFVALVYGNVISKGWAESRRSVFAGLALLLSLGSAAIYGMVAFGPPRPQPASFFLLIPAASCVVIGVVWAIGAVVGKRA
jgi:hypothetical protein